MLEELFTSKSRAEVFRVLFQSPEKSFYLRELERMVSVEINSLRKEINHLVSLDLIVSNRDGNRRYFRANVDHPLFLDLKNIVDKTVGLTALLANVLVADERVKYAFIFGSVAKGEETSKSDIDLLIVGKIGMRALSKLLSGIQEKLGREINPHIFTEEELTTRLKKNDHFVTSVIKSPKKMLKGELSEFEKICR